MRKFMVLAVLFAFLTTFTIEEACARAGGGKSSGSRGSRTYSAPAKPSQSPSSPSQVLRSQKPTAQTQSAQPSMWGGFMGMMAGGILGGLIGNMLFSSFAHGAGVNSYGGPGLFDLILIGLIIFVIYKFISSRRKSQQPIYAGGYKQYYSAVESQQQIPIYDTTTSTIEDTERGLSHIRQFDAAFDERRFKETVTDIFFRIQAAWTNRSMDPVRSLLTPEMFSTMSKEIETLRIEKRINRLENIAIRNLEITEAWQEEGKDFITVEITANVFDYVTDEAGRVIEGSNTEPVRFVEYWTFTRPVGPNQWQLSAIQQA